MSLNRELYNQVKTVVAGTSGLSSTLDAYAQAYFSEPPIIGEWTKETMQDELCRLLWNYHHGCIDLRRRSVESILRERLKSARSSLESTDLNWKLVSDEHEKMISFISRFHLEELFKEHLEDIRAGVFGLCPPDEELPFL